MKKIKANKNTLEFLCPECGYKGADFKLHLKIYTVCAAEFDGTSEFINLIRTILKEEYRKKNATRGFVCPHCSAPLLFKAGAES